ncbi:hypothetical protein ABKN59_007576 [Abortiporus biennis]
MSGTGQSKTQISPFALYQLVASSSFTAVGITYFPSSISSSPKLSIRNVNHLETTIPLRSLSEFEIATSLLQSAPRSSNETHVDSQNTSN